MIKRTFYKTIQFIQSSRWAQVKLLGIVLLLAVAAVQARVYKGRVAELTRIKEEKNVVAKIPKMEEKIKSKDLSLLKPESQIAAIQSILEGTSYRNGIYQAVIDGEIYLEGGMLGDYKIAKISMESIILRNDFLRETRKLFFPGHEEDSSLTE